MLSVLIVEDVETMRKLIREVLSGIPGVSISGTAANVPEARRELSRHRPGLVLLDLVLPGESGLELWPELREKAVPTLILSASPDPRVPEGALGWLLKPALKTLIEDRKRIQQALTVMLGLTGP